MMVYRLKNAHRSNKEAAKVGIIKIRERAPKEQKRQKVTSISQYRNSEMILATTSTGHLAVVNFQRMCTISVLKAHKGNITCGCYLQGYEYFATASGSFKGKTDNTIQIYKVFLTLGELLVRRLHSMNNAHGRYKGVMSLRSSNRQGDNLLISSGGEDDGRIRVWDFMERATINEIGNVYDDYRCATYNLSIIHFDDCKEDSDDEFSRGR